MLETKTTLDEQKQFRSVSRIISSIETTEGGGFVYIDHFQLMLFWI